MHYTVELIDISDIPRYIRAQAEARYRRVLEGKLGGARNVVYCLRAFLGAGNSYSADVPDAEYEAAAAYMNAQEAAQQAALEDLRDPLVGYFEVRL